MNDPRLSYPASGVLRTRKVTAQVAAGYPTFANLGYLSFEFHVYCNAAKISGLRRLTTVCHEVIGYTIT